MVSVYLWNLLRGLLGVNVDEWNVGPWKCFFCGEVFTSQLAAGDHFGATQLATAACQIKLEERGLVIALRNAEHEIETLRRANEDLDHEASCYHVMTRELQRHFGEDVRSPHSAWLKFEAMESRALVAEAEAEKVSTP